MVIDKRKRYHSNETLEINNKTVEAVWAAKLLGLTIDDNLNFNLQIRNIRKSAANQTNVLIQLRNLLGFEEK